MAGSHIVAMHDLYGGKLPPAGERPASARPRGNRVSFVDLSKPCGPSPSAIRPDTRLVWVETPDQPAAEAGGPERPSQALRARRHRSGCRSATTPSATPFQFSGPLEHGFGHRRALDHQVTSTDIQNAIGGAADRAGPGSLPSGSRIFRKRSRRRAGPVRCVPDPCGGIKTLALAHWSEHCANAARHRAVSFEQHPRKSSACTTRGLASHTQHSLRQGLRMGRWDSAVIVHGSSARGASRRRAAGRLERLPVWFALGGESPAASKALIEHPGIMTHSSLPAATREVPGGSANGPHPACRWAWRMSRDLDRGSLRQRRSAEARRRRRRAAQRCRSACAGPGIPRNVPSQWPPLVVARPVTAGRRRIGGGRARRRAASSAGKRAPIMRRQTVRDALEHPRAAAEVSAHRCARALGSGAAVGDHARRQATAARRPGPPRRRPVCAQENPDNQRGERARGPRRGGRMKSASARHGDRKSSPEGS